MASTTTPDLHYKVEFMGNENQPLVIVDNLFPNATTLIDAALSNRVSLPANGFYPGFRSPAPALYQKRILETLSPIIYESFGLEKNSLSKVVSFYAMVATPLNQLKPAQKIPHFDRPLNDQFAVIHYLCDTPHGGTSFYRHRQTGYETIDESRQEDYLKIVDREIREKGLADTPGFIHGDTQLFERIATKPAKFNRALIYRCSSLHSGNIEDDYAYDFNPRTGRFTVTSFIY